ncbi:cytochrome P450 [Streptomyces sp. NBC_00247]|uniref:cytochrome P450 n=1 Tax=Streptomyces sp. NBC_00247 TaxID=2975689 RepID=UPI002E29E370|nr:cytochrome P450 [Streptomyces sp. NBC_00247]
MLTEPPQTVEELGRRWSLFQPWLQEDPVPQFDKLRESAPIVRSEELGGFWILTRYEDIEWAAKTPEIFSNSKVSIPHIQLYADKQIPVQLDGEEHRLWRQTLTTVFNPAVVNQITPQIRQAAVELIEPIAKRGTCDAIADFAVPLPAETFLINFGIGRENLQQLLDHKDWLRKNAMRGTDEDRYAASKPLWRFFSEAVDKRRTAGFEDGFDVVSLLLKSKFEGRDLTQDEIVNVVFMTMLASLDTTNSILGLILLYLAEHPEVQEIIATSPEKIPLIIEELIRYQAMGASARVLTQDVERHGITMRAGDQVLMSWGMSGRDPEAFDHADQVDFDRSSVRHLSFGIGPHRCLGMHLARRILKVALEEWHRLVPSYHVTPGSTRTHHYLPVRGMDRLDLTVG